tara:strand:+ start:325 stop:927 length:603 start_codon:yes stop_codon:yes gene_type:complete
MKENQVPMFPLKSIVLPGGLFPLRIFERRYINMVKNSLKNQTGFCIALVRGESDNGYITNIFNYGCYVKIVDWNQLEDGLLGITVEGIKKIHVLECNLNKDNLLLGSIEDTKIEKEYMIPQKYLLLSKFYKKIYPNIKDFISFKNERYADATWVSYRLTECLPLDASTKNKLIALDNAIERLDKINEIVNKLYKKELSDL